MNTSSSEIKVIDGTNPFLDVLGDVATKRYLRLNNHSFFTRTETLTNVQIEAGATIDFALIGDIAFATLQNNIEQQNIGAGFEALKLEVLAIGDGWEGGTDNSPTDIATDLVFGNLQNCIYDAATHTYSYIGGILQYQGADFEYGFNGTMALPDNVLISATPSEKSYAYYIFSSLEDAVDALMAVSRQQTGCYVVAPPVGNDFSFSGTDGKPHNIAPTTEIKIVNKHLISILTDGTILDKDLSNYQYLHLVSMDDNGNVEVGDNVTVHISRIAT